MPTPAEILLEHSALTTGTPWEHLNAQLGGAGGGLVLVDSYEVELMTEALEIELDQDDLEVEIPDDSTQVELIDDSLEVDLDA